MGTPSFGLPTSGNNAPLPIPGNTNPTGTNAGVGYGGSSFPNYPIFGSPNNGVVSPSANSPVFGTSSMAGLSTGLATSLTGQPGNPGDHLYKELTSTYGKGMGATLFEQLTSGLFNPQVASAFLNAMQPGIAQGQTSVLDSFGAEGSRFGSAAALGVGNYQSQVNLNENQTLAGLYQNAQTEQLNLETGLLPTLHAEQANKGSWVDTLIGGLEIAGSIAGAPFTGGASLMALPAGLSMFNKGVSPSSGGSSGSPSPSFGTANPMTSFGNTGTFGANAPTYNSQSSFLNSPQWQEMLQYDSASQALGGSGGGGSAYDPSLLMP